MDSKLREIRERMKLQAELTDSGIEHQVILQQDDYIYLWEQTEQNEELQDLLNEEQENAQLLEATVESASKITEELLEENKELKEAGRFFESGYRQLENDIRKYKTENNRLQESENCLVEIRELISDIEYPPGFLEEAIANPEGVYGLSRVLFERYSLLTMAVEGVLKYKHVDERLKNQLGAVLKGERL
ncbi:hypothetical protein [Oceanobacillus oncorhynchi]|uniref:hypothetical protein n=1 Tax=Oceanobacillus oncorhynchi TaxID=545501 RepID=UPI0034D3A9A1